MTKQNLIGTLCSAGVHYLILSLILTMSCLFVQGETTGTKEQPGCIADIRKPWAYMVGFTNARGHVRVNGHYYTNVVFKALGASMLDTQTIYSVVIKCRL